MVVYQGHVYEIHVTYVQCDTLTLHDDSNVFHVLNGMLTDVTGYILHDLYLTTILQVTITKPHI